VVGGEDRNPSSCNEIHCTREGWDSGAIRGWKNDSIGYCSEIWSLPGAALGRIALACWSCLPMVAVFRFLLSVLELLFDDECKVVVLRMVMRTLSLLRLCHHLCFADSRVKMMG